MYNQLIYVLIFVILVSCIYTPKQKEHYYNRYSGKNKCGEPDAGPFDRPRIQPACFAYDITKENEKLYGIMKGVTQNLDNEMTRTQDINNKLSDLAITNTNNINSLHRGPIVTGINTNLKEGKELLKSSSQSSLYNALNSGFYKINVEQIEKEVRAEIDKYLAQVIQQILDKNNINFSDSVKKRFNSEMKSKIANPIYNMFINKFNKNNKQDIYKLLQSILKDIDVDEGINILIDNMTLSDPTLKSFISRPTKLKIGDFVYFRHKLDKPVNEVCADNEEMMDIIVGGSICQINDIKNTAKLSYNFVMNPNKNNRCQGLQSTNPSRINYGLGPEGLPKWYPETNETVNCGTGAPVGLACKPSQWGTGKNRWGGDKDEWVRTYIGGFNRNNDSMDCGVGPSRFNLPSEIPISILHTDLNKLIADCGGVNAQIKDKVMTRIKNSNARDISPPAVMPSETNIIQTQIQHETEEPVIYAPVPDNTEPPKPIEIPNVVPDNTKPIEIRNVVPTVIPNSIEHPNKCEKMCIDSLAHNNKDVFLTRGNLKFYFKNGKLTASITKGGEIIERIVDKDNDNNQLNILRAYAASKYLLAYVKNTSGFDYYNLDFTNGKFLRLTQHDLDDEFSNLKFSCCFPSL